MTSFNEALSTVFIKVFNMSISAGWVILAVIALRLLLKKAPKAVTGALWTLVALRLICPFSIESALSLIPSAKTVDYSVNDFRPYIESGISPINEAANSYLGDHFFEGVTVPIRQSPANPVNIISVIWAAGILIFLGYYAASYIRLKRRVKKSIPFEHNVYDALLCESLKTPFILGVFRPVIYLPSFLSEKQRQFVIAHERAHLARRDHIWKPLGFLLLSVYWFNPLCWAAYILFCRDIELACDEKVIGNIDLDQRKDYSRTLLELSTGKSIFAAFPPAFGEVGVKQRIKSALNYKKPTLLIMICAAVILAVSSVCLLTDPINKGRAEEDNGLAEITAASGKEDVVFQYVYGSFTAADPCVYVKWKNAAENKMVLGSGFSLYYNNSLCENKTPVSDAALSLNSGGEIEDKFELRGYDLSHRGYYLIKKQYWFESDPDAKYTAELRFVIGEKYSFAGKAFKVDSLARAYPGYDPQNLEKIQFAVDESLYCYLNLNLRGTNISDMYCFGMFTQSVLQEGMFSAEKEGWLNGFNGSTLEKNNLYLYSALNGSNGERCYLSVQNNGELFLSYGSRDDSSAAYLVFKLKQTGETAENKNFADPEFGTLSDKMYRAEKIVYRPENADSEINENALPSFGISRDRTLYVLESPSTNQHYLGTLNEVYPNAASLQDEFGCSKNFGGFSLEKLIKDNERAYKAREFGENYYCYVFKQKDGKIYIAYANSSTQPRITAVFRVSATGESFYVGSYAEAKPAYYIQRRSGDISECPCIMLDGKGQFAFTPSLSCSYIGRGSYAIENNKLILKSRENDFRLVFDLKDNETASGYFYNEKSSVYDNNTHYFDIPDGAEFEFSGTDRGKFLKEFDFG